MILRALQWMHGRIALANAPLTALALILLGFVGFAAMVQYNQRSAFCTKCHVNRGPYRNIDLQSAAHKPYAEGKKDCLDCHTDKDFHAWARQTVIAGAQAFERFTNDTGQLAYRLRNVSDETCLGCHEGMLERGEADRIELSPGLAKIGLVFDHRRHFEIKEYSPTLQQERDDLRRSAEQPSGDMTAEKMERLTFLERVRIGHCAQCHERKQPIPKDQGARKLDRNIHFYTSNPMRCSGCHVDAVTAAHPGPPLTPPLGLPSEAVCRRCHNGKVHGRLVTFPARCETDFEPFTDHCKTCHPDVQPGVDRKNPLRPGAQIASH